VTRRIRQALFAAAAALVAGVAALLGLAAATEAWTSRGSAVLLALAAVWVSQVITRLTRRPTPTRTRQEKPC
jgi:hypothetical protein